MKKRVITIGLACLTAGIGLAGCAGSNEQPTEATTTAETTTAAETTTTTAETTTTTQETTTATEAPVYDNDNPPAAYKKIITKHYNWINSTENPNSAKSFIFGGESKPRSETVISYCVQDINADAIPELMITNDNNNNIYEVYTLNGDEAVLLIDGGYRSGLWIDEDNDICQQLSGGAESYIYSKYRLEKGASALSLVESATVDWGTFNKTTPAEGYDPVNAPDNTKTVDITEEEFKVYNDRIYNKAYDILPFKTTPLRSFDTDSGIVAASDSAEDDVFMDYLRQYYNTHDTSAGTPSPDEYGHYTKYAIADFDADGRNELAVEYKYDHDGYKATNTFIYTADNLDFDDFMRADRADNYGLTDVTFLDNGVAYRTVNDRYYYANNTIDKKAYYILSDRVLEQLNYNLNNFGEGAGTFNLYYYYDENGKIMKCLAGGSEHYFDPVEKTQEQYNADKAILNSGNVMNIEIKDFTAENIGL